MAEMPADIASSAAGAPIQAREAVKEREARRAGQVQAADRQVKSIDEAGSTVDTDDADTQVFADAEGTGSAGREFEEEGGDDAQSAAETSDDGVTHDEDGKPHLDLKA